MAMVLTNRDSFPRKTGVDEGPLFSRSLLPVSRASGVSGFSQRCTNARARAHTRARSRDPGRSIQDRVAALSEGNSHSPKRKLIHHARIPPVISGEQSGEYYKSTSSPFHLLVPDRSPPPPLPLPPSLLPFLPSSLPPSKREDRRKEKKKNDISHNFSTLFVYIYICIYFFFTICGQPPPCWGNTCSTLTSTARSLITRKKSRERTSGHLSAGILRNFETLHS